MLMVLCHFGIHACWFRE